MADFLGTDEQTGLKLLLSRRETKLRYTITTAAGPGLTLSMAEWLGLVELVERWKGAPDAVAVLEAPGTSHG